MTTSRATGSPVRTRSLPPHEDAISRCISGTPFP
jgi:hypothetical protein